MQLFLTPKSQPILEEMHARAAEVLTEAMRGLTPRVQRQLVAGLEQIKHNLATAETAAAKNTAVTSRHGRVKHPKPLRARV